MKTFSIALLLLGLTAPVSGADRHARVEALPVIARIQEGKGTPFLLRGKLTPQRARRMQRLARAVVQDITRRFLSDKDKSGRTPVDVCLFETSRAYNRFVRDVYGGDERHSDLGFYSPSRRLVVANLGRSVGNLRHEIVHPLLGDDFDDLPAWLNEGFGSLYGTAAWQKKGFRSSFRYLVNYRLRHLKAARKAGLLPDLEELAASTDQDVYGLNAGAYYSLARYLLLYLDRKGKLDEFVKTLRSKPMTPTWQREVLERYIDYADFLAWTDRLRYRRVRT